MPNERQRCGKLAMSTHDILTDWCDCQGLDRCYLTNARKKLYAQKVLHVWPDTNRICIEAPTGRQAQLDPKGDWLLNFSNQKGLWQIKISEIRQDSDGLVLDLEKQGHALQRRQSVRIASNQESDAECTFQWKGHPVFARILDISTGGLGLRLNHQPDLQPGDIIEAGTFSIGAHEAKFTAATVAHVDKTLRGTYIGLEFKDLTLTKSETVKKLFSALMHEQESE